MFALLAITLTLAASAQEDDTGQEQPTPAPQEAAPPVTLQRPGRIEFDERLVKGQGAASGAVYLFKRVPRDLPGLVPMRQSFRSQIVEPVLGERELLPVVTSVVPVTEAEEDGAPVRSEHE